MFVDKFKNRTVYFFNWNTLLIRVTMNLIVVETDSALLVALSVLKDSAPVGEYTMSDVTKFDF